MSVQILAEHVYNFETNKGKFYFSVFDINMDIVVGSTIGTDAFYCIASPHSVFCSPDAKTEFTSANGCFKYSNNKFSIYNLSGQEIHSVDVPSTPTYGYIFYMYIFRGTNDVYFLSIDLIQNVTTNSQGAVYVPNTTDTFGTYARPTFQGIGGFSVSALEITMGDILKQSIFPDPNIAGGLSTNGGGTGTFNLTSDPVDFALPPSLSAVSAGFITLYSPTLAQLNSLAAYMWTEDFVTAIVKLFSDPMQAILGLSIVPVSVPVSGSEEIKVGFVSTGVSANIASSQYITLDCGTLTPEEYWGSALDYSPYTKFTIFLPYIGAREIDTIDIMGKSIQVKYNIDILSGACTAMVKCGDAVKYQFSGSCAASIPITGRDFTSLLTASIQLASIGAATVATGGATAAGLVPSTANAVSAMRPNVQRSSAVSGSAGLLGAQKPYLIWELPRQSLAKDYNKFVGYPSNITALLSTLSGFTQVEVIHLENISATENELQEIENLLKGGVML